ncbi:MAG TPA: hypothetical protein VJP02_15440 [Candidatus Sulfotelmatobacter sp.]|nr:hypothetical protein [Candidatus Sulfotelmatobacter sp.]
MDGNTTLSPNAQKAIKRIRTLRELSDKTGLITRDEQIKILLGLEDDDCLAVADAVGIKRGATNVSR